MFNIEQSPFLHALGYAIGHSLWQMSLLWLVYSAINYLHQWKSSQRYNLAAGAATSGFLIFIITFFYYSSQVAIDSSVVSVSGMKDQYKLFTPGNKLLFFYHSVMATLRSLAPYFSCAYLFVMMLLSIRLVNGFKEVKQLRSQGLSKAGADWRIFVKEHSALLGIKRQVQLHISRVATTPLTIGFWKPFILIPMASINQLSPQQMEAVLLHELAHIRRNDYLLNIVLQLAEITLFFNPFMRVLLKQARLERENSCDDYVLQFQYNATDYAKALLAIEQHSVESILALGTNSNNEFQLLNRIKRMLAPERRAFNYRQQLGLLFIITILGLGFAVITPKQEPPKEVPVVYEDTKFKKVIAEPVNENAMPDPIDLIKNLENIQQFSRQKKSEIAKEKSRKLEALAVKAATNIEEEMAPHLKNVKSWALEFEKMRNGQIYDIKALAAGAERLKVMANTDWSSIVGPTIQETLKVLANPGVFRNAKVPSALFVPAAPPPPNAPTVAAAEHHIRITREQQKQLEHLQEQISDEQKAIEKFSNVQKLVAERIRPSGSIPEQVVLSREIAMAKKAAAIAPFRERDNNAVVYYQSAAPNNFQFNISSNSDDEFAEAENEKLVNVYGRGSKSMIVTNNCECADQPKSKGKKIMVFNAKAFSEKIKKVWSEAQQSESGWTEAMQQKVVREIEKELRSLEHVEIKTRIEASPTNNNSMLVIEVEEVNN